MVALSGNRDNSRLGGESGLCRVFGAVNWWKSHCNTKYCLAIKHESWGWVGISNSQPLEKPGEGDFPLACYHSVPLPMGEMLKGRDNCLTQRFYCWEGSPWPWQFL